jgi:hypothetical protein
VELPEQAVGAVRGLERHGKRVARSPLFQHLTRWGFFTKALVHATVGALALATALGRGGTTTDTRGAIRVLARQPEGATLLVLLAVGLAGLAVWFVLDGLADPRATKRSRAGAWQRVGQVLLGLFNGALALWTVRLVAGARPGPASDTLVKGWTAEVLDLPGGQAVAFVAGLVILALAAHQLRTGLGRRFLPNLHLRAMPPWLRRGAVALGMAGFSTQGAVLGMVGGWAVRAAFDDNPHEARGIDGALTTLAHRGDGALLLAACAAGLLAYAAYALVEGAYGKR